MTEQEAAAYRMQCFKEIASLVDRIVENQLAELNGNLLTDGIYQGMKRAAAVIRAGAEHVGEAEEIHQRHARVFTEIFPGTLSEKQWSEAEEIQKRYAPGLHELANGQDRVEEYLETIADLGKKLGEANQREKKLRDRFAELESFMATNGGKLRSARAAIYENASLRRRISELEAMLLAVDLPQGQAYPVSTPDDREKALRDALLRSNRWRLVELDRMTEDQIEQYNKDDEIIQKALTASSELLKKESRAK